MADMRDLPVRANQWSRLSKLAMPGLVSTFAKASAGERVGGLAQRVRARRGPMTGSGVTRSSIFGCLADYASLIRPMGYGLSGRIDFFAGGMSPRRAECLNAFWYDGLLRRYERTFSPFHRRVITTDALEVGASGEGDNRDPLFSAFRAVRYPIHEILPIFPLQLGTGIFVPFERFGVEKGGV